MGKIGKPGSVSGKGLCQEIRQGAGYNFKYWERYEDKNRIIWFVRYMCNVAKEHGDIVHEALLNYYDEK